MIYDTYSNNYMMNVWIFSEIYKDFEKKPNEFRIIQKNHWIFSKFFWIALNFRNFRLNALKI